MKIMILGRQVWPWPRPARKHVADHADPRSPAQRWEDGPAPAPPGGSMIRSYEREGRRLYSWAEEPLQPLWNPRRCDDTDEYTAGTVMMPRFGGQTRYGPLAVEWPQPPAVLAPFCPRCEAPDDRPHYSGCPFYDPDEAALLYGAAKVYEARNLSPAAWRPYLTEAEFAEAFPGVPYAPADDDDDGPHTGDLLHPLPPALAAELDQRDAEHRDYLAQRAAAHADARARMILAWQAIWQHS